MSTLYRLCAFAGAVLLFSCKLTRKSVSATWITYGQTLVVKPDSSFSLALAHDSGFSNYSGKWRTSGNLLLLDFSEPEWKKQGGCSYLQKKNSLFGRHKLMHPRDCTNTTHLFLVFRREQE